MPTAMENALAEIGDTFRAEREEHSARINQACRVRELVLSHRMTFQQALEQLEVRVDWMLESFEWTALDNFALNEKYDTAKHRLFAHQLEAWQWLKRISGQE